MTDPVSLQVSCTDSAGEALIYSGTGLPPGLGISSGGLITGTLTTAGTYTVTVTATDTSGQNGHTTFAWTISGSSVTCTSPGDQVNTVGDAVSLQITATDSAGETLTYSGGTLPPGLTIDRHRPDHRHTDDGRDLPGDGHGHRHLGQHGIVLVHLDRQLAPTHRRHLKEENTPPPAAQRSMLRATASGPP